MILISEPEWQKAALLQRQQSSLDTVLVETAEAGSRQPIESTPLTEETISRQPAESGALTKETVDAGSKQPSEETEPRQSTESATLTEETISRQPTGSTVSTEVTVEAGSRQLSESAPLTDKTEEGVLRQSTEDAPITSAEMTISTSKCHSSTTEHSTTAPSSRDNASMPAEILTRSPKNATSEAGQRHYSSVDKSSIPSIPASVPSYGVDQFTASNDILDLTSTPSQTAPDTYTAFPFPTISAASASTQASTEPSQQTMTSISTPQLLRQAMSMMNNADMTELPYIEPSQSAASPGLPRQLFDGDTPFTDLFPSPNVYDRKISQSWDRKLDAMNKRLATLSRQQTEITRMLTYIIQKLNSNDRNATSNLQNHENEPLTTDTFVPIVQPSTPSSIVAAVTPAAASLSTMSSSSTITSVASCQIDEQFSDIPLPYRIPADELLKKKREAQSIGNFASALTILLFPELFTEENLRFKYNYNGVRYGKESLDMQRKSYLQRYMLYFYPHLSDVKAYHCNVIDPVNEILRRKNLKTRTPVNRMNQISI